jgi:hypothetical protein
VQALNKSVLQVCAELIDKEISHVESSKLRNCKASEKKA